MSTQLINKSQGLSARVDLLIKFTLKSSAQLVCVAFGVHASLDFQSLEEHFLGITLSV